MSSHSKLFEGEDGEYGEFSAEEEKTFECCDGDTDVDESFNQQYVQAGVGRRNTGHKTLEAIALGRGGHLFGKLIREKNFVFF